MVGASSQFNRETILALLEASRAILNGTQLQQVLQSVAEQAAVVLRAEGASVLLLDESHNELVFHAATGPVGQKLIGQRFDARLGIAGQILSRKRPVRVDDVRKNQNFFAGVDEKTHMRTRSLIAAPMIHQDRVVGAVEVLNPEGRDHFTDTDLDLLQVFTNLAAAAVHRGQVFDRVQRQNQGLRLSIPATQIVGRSEPLQQVLDLCRRVAPTNSTVVVSGETGTGKELVARQIHELSDRADQSFIAVNCAALPESLLESELFGHERGAFTGATEQKLGRFELAEGGTLFLDELGEMDLNVQVKLLRVLEQRQFMRVGGSQTINSDVRVVTATNRDLKSQMAEGKFREDLYYRLNVFPIEVPPLRRRIQDLPLLVDHFVSELAPSLGVARLQVTEDAMAALCNYQWPGNIRELRNIIERCALLASDGRISRADLPPEICDMGGSSEFVGEAAPDRTDSALARQERALLVKALVDNNWNQSAAARQLDISRDHIRYRIKKYGLSKTE